jgi:nitrite reductase/ring-hydroxylating ferredoxin subunit
MTNWVRVAATGDLADGDLAAFEVGGAYVAVARVDGEYYAFGDTCTHRACSLSEGELDGTTVICPCHAGEFDVRTGEVLDGPPPESVASYPARAVGDSIEIAI